MDVKHCKRMIAVSQALWSFEGLVMLLAAYMGEPSTVWASAVFGALGFSSWQYWRAERRKVSG